VAEQARLQALGREFQALSLKLRAPSASCGCAGQGRGAHAVVKQPRGAAPRRDRCCAELLSVSTASLAKPKNDRGHRPAPGRRERERATLLASASYSRPEGVPAGALSEPASSATHGCAGEGAGGGSEAQGLELCLPLAALRKVGLSTCSVSLRSEAQRVQMPRRSSSTAKHERERERLRRENDAQTR